MSLSQPFFQRAYSYAPGDLPVSYRLFRQTLALPLFAQMTEAEQDHVISSLPPAIAEARKVS